MKKIYALILGCVVSATAFAQSDSKLSYGVKAGVNIAKAGLSGNLVDDEEKDAQKSLLSFQIGGYVDYALTEKISIQPGLTLSGKGSKAEYSGSEGGDSYEDTETTNLMYLEIPINAVYKYNNFYVGAGPYFGYALSGKNKEESKWTEDGESGSDKEEADVKFGSDADKLKRGDFGLNVLAGYQLTNGFNVGLNYGLGLSSISNVDEYKVKNRVFSVTVGFKF